MVFLAVHSHGDGILGCLKMWAFEAELRSYKVAPGCWNEGCMWLFKICVWTLFYKARILKINEVLLSAMWLQRRNTLQTFCRLTKPLWKSGFSQTWPRSTVHRPNTDTVPVVFVGCSCFMNKLLELNIYHEFCCPSAGITMSSLKMSHNTPQKKGILWNH